MFLKEKSKNPGIATHLGENIPWDVRKYVFERKTKKRKIRFFTGFSFWTCAVLNFRVP